MNPIAHPSSIPAVVHRPVRLSWARLAWEGLRCNLAGLYPGLLDWIGIRPLFANFWVTTRCSGRCRTCTQWRDTDRDEMSTGELKETLVALKRAGIRIVYLVGGDVFLRDDIFELIRFAASLDLRVHLTINTYTVTREIAQALMASRVASVHLSLDMLGEDLDQVRGVPEAAQKVAATLALLREADRHRQVRLGITTTIMKCTLPHIRDIVQLAIANNLTIFFNLINFTHHFFATDFSQEQYGLNEVEKQDLRSLVQWLKERRAEHPRLLPRSAHLDWIQGYFDDHRRQWPPCYQTMLKVCVRPNGDIRPCCSMETAGNLRTQDLRSILASPGYVALLKKALRKQCPGCSCRYTLNLDVSLASRLGARR